MAGGELLTRVAGDGRQAIATLPDGTIALLANVHPTRLRSGRAKDFL
jgi:hypothetical protein